MVEIADSSFRALMRKAETEGVSNPIEVAILKRTLPAYDKAMRVEKMRQARSAKLVGQKAHDAQVIRDAEFVRAKARKRSKPKNRKGVLDLKLVRAEGIVSRCEAGVMSAQAAGAARRLRDLQAKSTARRQRRMILAYRRDRSQQS